MNYTNVWIVFGCGNPICDGLLKVEVQTIESAGSAAVVKCDLCGHENNISEIKKGGRWKYCRVCEQLQPLDNFHRHASQKSGRQLECKVCKNRYINPKLNPLRTADQHRESGEGRRLFGLLAKDRHLSTSEERRVYERFEYRCFNCGCSLKLGEGQLDHTLPARFLWPLGTGPTLLCRACNASKAERWPSEFYTNMDGTPNREKLQTLSYLTGIPFSRLAGEPELNEKAVEELLLNADDVLARFIRYPDMLRRLDNDLKRLRGIDIRKYASGNLTFLDEVES